LDKRLKKAKKEKRKVKFQRVNAGKGGETVGSKKILQKAAIEAFETRW